MRDIIIAEVIIVLFIHLIVRRIWNLCVVVKFLLFTMKWRYDVVRNHIIYDDESYIDFTENDVRNFMHGKEGSYAKTIYDQCQRYIIPNFRRIFKDYFGKGVK